MPRLTGQSEIFRFVLYMPNNFRYKQSILNDKSETPSGSTTMELERKAGIAIVFGIAAIVGGGLTWQLSGSWQVVGGYLAILGFVVGGLIANPEQILSIKNKSE
jgi:hypothetical protein